MSSAGCLPSATEIAHALGGCVRPDGCIAYPGPGRKPKDRSCTLKLDASAPGGFIVSDARKEIDDLTLKDDARARIGLEPFSHRRSNGNGHNPACPSGVRDRSTRDHRNEEGEVAKTKRLHLLSFNAIRLTTKRRDLVKGLIPRIGLTLVYGPPKSGKSFLTFDLAAHVALGRDYRGRRVEQGAAVYCSFEGQSAASARIEAFRQRHLAESAEDVPFYLMPVTINLVVEQQALIAAIRAELGRINPAVIVLDTLNRSFQGSESSDQDMSAYVKAVDAVREAFECARSSSCITVDTMPPGRAATQH
jgi:AAA domain-containing protein